MRPARVRILLIFLGFTGGTFLGGSPEAQARRAELVPGSRYTSAQGASMGDAVLPLGEDVATGLFYNPATLGRVRRPSFEPVNLTLQGNSHYVGSINGTSATKVASLGSYSSELGKSQGFNPGVGFSLLPNIGWKGFGFGLLLNERVMARSDGGNINYRSMYQIIPAAGGSLRLASGVLRLGYSLQWVNMAKGDVVTSSSSSTLGYTRGLQQGAGFSHNFGFALTLPYQYLPSLNVVARNVGGVHYKTGSLIKFSPDPSGTPANESMSTDASISYESKTGAGGSFNTVLEYRDITATSGAPVIGRVALGLELNLRDRFFIRTGFSSMTGHAGVAFRSQRGELGISWYSEDVGSSYHQVRDRRFMLSYRLRAF